MNTNGVIIPTERDAASIAFEQWKAEYEEYLTAFSERNANRKLDSQVETSNGVDELEADEVCSVYAFDKDEAAEVKSVTNEDVEVDSDDDEEESDSEEDSSDDDDEADDIWSEYAFDFYGWDEESEYAMDWYTDYDDSEWSSEDELTDADESDAEEDDEVDGGGLECAVNKNADGAVDSNDNDKMCNAEDDLAALSNEDEGGDEKGDEVDDGASEYAFNKETDDGAVDVEDNDAVDASQVDSSDEEEDYNDDDDNYSIVSDYAFDFYGSDGVESEYAFDYQEYDSDEDSDSDDGLEDEVVAEPKGNQVVDEAKEVVAEPKKVAQGPAKIRTVEDPWCRFKWPITSNGLRGNYTPAKSVKTFSDWKAVIMEDLQYRFMFFCICGPALFVIHCMLKMY